MLKFIFIVAIVFGIYKLYFSDGHVMTSPELVVSTEHKFSVELYGDPRVSSDKQNIPTIGQLVSTTYITKNDDFTCSVIVAGFPGLDQHIGYLEDTIEPAKRVLSRRFGEQSLLSEGYITKSDISGYELKSKTKNNMQMTMQSFVYNNNTYNLSCYYSETFSAKAHSVIDSFQFI